MAIEERRGPRPLAEILGALFAARGYGRLRGTRELEEAWEAAVGEPGPRLQCERLFIIRPGP